MDLTNIGQTRRYKQKQNVYYRKSTIEENMYQKPENINGTNKYMNIDNIWKYVRCHML